jgi:hypothetical protein
MVSSRCRHLESIDQFGLPKNFTHAWFRLIWPNLSGKGFGFALIDWNVGPVQPRHLSQADAANDLDTVNQHCLVLISQGHHGSRESCLLGGQDHRKNSADWSQRPVEPKFAKVNKAFDRPSIQSSGGS